MSQERSPRHSNHGGDLHGNRSNRSPPAQQLSHTNKENVDNDNNNKHDNNDNGADPSLRPRRCTEKGREFFKEESLKNRTRCLKTIQNHVKQIEDLLQSGSVNEAMEVIKTLMEVHEEFVRAHLRYQGFAEETPAEIEQEGLLEEVQRLITATSTKAEAASLSCHQRRFQGEVEELVLEIEGLIREGSLNEASDKMKDLNLNHEQFLYHLTGFSVQQDELQQKRSEDILRLIATVGERLAEALDKQNMPTSKSSTELRLSLYGKIQSVIEEIENHIKKGDLNQADVLAGTLDNLFSDFMSTTCNPGATSEVNCAQESKFIDLVDGEVFAVKRKLAKAKSNNEIVNVRNDSLSNLSASREQTRHTSHISRSKDRSARHSRNRSPHSSCSRKSHRSSSSKRREKSKRSVSPANSHRSNSTVRSAGSSGRSSSSSTRSAREKAMDERARLAALRIESRYLDQAQRSSLEKKRLEMEED